MKKTYPTIAYILKGYPRNSEVFITNEIHLLERMGLDLHIFSAFKPTDLKSHAVVTKIQAPVTYLPEVESTIDAFFSVWLLFNFPRYVSRHVRVFFSHPLTYAKTAGEALRLSFRCRTKGKVLPKKVFYKDFIRAGAIACELMQSPNIRHLHAHFCHGATTMALFVSQLTGIPFSFTAHAKDIYLPKLNPGNLLRHKLDRTQFVVTCTDANRRYLRTLAPESTPIHTVYHGLDTAWFVPTEQPKTEYPVILSIGRFVQKKGFEFLVQACRILRDRGFVFHCQVVGEPDEQSGRIQKLIKDLQLDDVVELGPGRTQDELKKLYAQATVFALPCQIVKNGDRDGIPNVLAEAMAMEVPVVSTDVSGIPELITNEVHGLLVPQQNAMALAEALATLLDQPSLRKRLGQAGRERICEIFDSKTNTLSLRSLFVASFQENKTVNDLMFDTVALAEKS